MTARRPAMRQLAVALACLLPFGAALAADAPVAPVAERTERQGREIYQSFVDGLADRDCSADSSDRWRRHFAHVPADLARTPDRLLPLFGYVVDQLRAQHLPTEYALIPFVESGYRPGARSASGPAGLWQFIALTARNHKVPIRPGYDGRLSPVDSTQAAVRYLKTLHGMFAGDWRLAVMGYNAGEYRLFGALRQAGQRAADARPEELPMPQTTRAYVRKLQALSCLLLEAGEREEWLQAIDHTVPVLVPAPLPRGAGHLDSWASREGHDPGQIRRFNPAFPDGRIASADRNLQVLAPARAGRADSAVAAIPVDAPGTAGSRTAVTSVASVPARAPAAEPVHYAQAVEPPRSHVVARGESVWRIARRYGIGVAQLLARNGLSGNSVLHPGMTLLIDDVLPGGTAAVETAQGSP
ncbi:lytic transglycosylase domain-containing protein [Luteimonas sp. MHLX1A]|uniref:lytic transglycosylase domain-containing protein n=1 Tax=Alterluteimonas muca TaxID=2878684 RepID=UPI001E3E2744|nr:lytic transglycosylase domain-containing protein [Luteimonas sp. MHLX1A]MCD9045963.1 transglycosylase SLT domain-containing protein [Luteimonas sp. MHLX1A]